MPNLTEIDYRRARSGRTQTDTLYTYLTERPGQWFGMPDLAHEIGAYAVHSRIADVRRRLALTGMPGRIENRQHVDPQTGRRHSYYRYLPD